MSVVYVTFCEQERYRLGVDVLGCWEQESEEVDGKMNLLFVFLSSFLLALVLGREDAFYLILIGSFLARHRLTWNTQNNTVCR